MLVSVPRVPQREVVQVPGALCCYPGTPLEAPRGGPIDAAAQIDSLRFLPHTFRPVPFACCQAHISAPVNGLRYYVWARRAGAPPPPGDPVAKCGPGAPGGGYGWPPCTQYVLRRGPMLVWCGVCLGRECVVSYAPHCSSGGGTYITIVGKTRARIPLKSLNLIVRGGLVQF